MASQEVDNFMRNFFNDENENEYGEIVKKKPIKLNGNFIAIQRGCNNFIFKKDNNSHIFGNLDEANKVTEFAVRHNRCGYDSNEGDVVIYELVPTSKIKIPIDVKIEDIRKKKKPDTNQNKPKTQGKIKSRSKRKKKKGFFGAIDNFMEKYYG